MKKIVILEENELEELIKNAMLTKAIISQIVGYMDKNMKHEDMGINPSTVLDIYSKLKAAENAIDNVNDVLE